MKEKYPTNLKFLLLIYFETSDDLKMILLYKSYININ